MSALGLGRRPQATRRRPDLWENVCLLCPPPGSWGSVTPGLLTRGSASSGDVNRDLGGTLKDRLQEIN